MKKKFFSLMLCLCLVFTLFMCMGGSAYAYNYDIQDTYNGLVLYQGDSICIPFMGADVGPTLDITYADYANMSTYGVSEGNGTVYVENMGGYDTWVVDTVGDYGITVVPYTYNPDPYNPTPVSSSYAVIVDSGAGGSAWANTSYASPGNTVYLSTSANKGYQFSYWQVIYGGVSIYASTFTMPWNDVEVKAIFEQVSPSAYEIQVTTDGNGSASADYYNAQPGMLITLSATPNPGYVFDHWETYSGGMTVNSNGQFTMPNSVATVNAIFSQAIYTITVNSDKGGSVTGAGNYTGNSSATVVATADPGYTFKGWKENGAMVSTEPNLTFTVTSARTLTADFEGATAKLTVTGGTGTGSYDELTKVAIAANAAPEGYSFKEWKLNSGDGTIADPKSASTVYTMGVSAAALEAVYEPGEAKTVAPAAAAAAASAGISTGMLIAFVAVAAVAGGAVVALIIALGGKKKK